MLELGENQTSVPPGDLRVESRVQHRGRQGRHVLHVERDVATTRGEANDGGVEQGQPHELKQLALRGRRKTAGQQDVLHVVHVCQPGHPRQGLAPPDVEDELMDFVEHDTDQTTSRSDVMNIRDKGLVERLLGDDEDDVGAVGHLRVPHLAADAEDGTSLTKLMFQRVGGDHDDGDFIPIQDGGDQQHFPFAPAHGKNAQHVLARHDGFDAFSLGRLERAAGVNALQDGEDVGACGRPLGDGRMPAGGGRRTRGGGDAERVVLDRSRGPVGVNVNRFTQKGSRLRRTWSGSLCTSNNRWTDSQTFSQRFKVCGSAFTVVRSSRCA